MRSILIAILLCLSSVARAEGPVVVIGLDAATFDIIDPMVARGELPNIARLLKRGSRAVLKSEKPIRSPALWTTIATGEPRHVHGIYDFVTGSKYWPEEQRSKDSRLVTSDMRRSRALWQYASDAGQEVLVVGWLNSWPAEKVNGTMVAPYVALGQHKQTSIKGKIYEDAEAQTYPRELFQTLVPQIVSPQEVDAKLVAELVDVPPPGSALYTKIPKLERYLYTVRWSLASALTNFALIEKRLAAGESPRLVMTYFDGSDTLAHRFWLFREAESKVRQRLARHGFDPELAPELIARFGGIVDNYYRFIDRRLGTFLEGLPQDSTIVLVSDHGFGSYPRARAIHSSTPFDGMHTLNGILIAAGPGVNRGQRLDALTHYDLVPTLLYRLGLPVPSSLEGRVVSELFTESFNRARAQRVTRASTRREAKEAATKETHFEDDEIERLRSLGYVQ